MFQCSLRYILRICRNILLMFNLTINGKNKGGYKFSQEVTQYEI